MIAILTLLIIILDQTSKFVVIREQGLLPKDVIKDVFSIDFVKNTGAAFGLLPNQTIFFILISIAAIIFITIFACGRNPSRYTKIALSLILGGAIGNLIDRIRFGYVIDFLDFKIWPVFNIADSVITIGVVLLILRFLTLKVKSKK